MDRKIVVDVNGSYLRKDNKIAGVQGEGNSTYLNLIFDEGWSSLAKKITFWNSKGMNPVEITLTADHLTDMSVSLLDYTVPIPPEPLEFDGEMEYVIDGYKDGIRVRSLADKMVVKYAPTANNAGSPADPTPTQAEQLQKQIDTMLGDMQTERIKAETAASTSQQAAETSVLAKGSAESAAQTATTKAGEASDSASAAKISEENAKQSETNAKASEEIVENNTQTAINKALEAKQALEETITAKNSAESAKTVAETARDEALTAKTAAESAQSTAETARDESVSAKEYSVAAKEAAETAKNESISAKEDAVAAKIAAETARDQAQEIAGGDFATRAELTEGLSTKSNHTLIIIPAGRMRGDADGDGNIDDVNALMNSEYYNTKIDQTNIDAMACDINCDGWCNSTDLNVLLTQFEDGKFPEVTGNWTNNPNYATEDGKFYTDIPITGMTANHSASVIVKGTFENGFFPKAECIDGAIRIYAKLCPISEVMAIVEWGTGDGTAVITTENTDSYNKAEIDNKVSNINAAIGNKTNKPTISTSTMSASGWSNSVYSFESTYPHAEYDIEIEVDGDNCTSDQLKAWNSAQIVGSSTTNSCKAFGDVPTIDIPIIVKAVMK